MTAQASAVEVADVSAAPLPAGPRGRVLQTMRYLRDPYAYYERAQKRSGRFFLMPTMNGDLLITGTPEGVDELFNVKSRHLLAEFGADSLRPLVGPSSLLLLSGDRHRRPDVLAWTRDAIRGLGPDPSAADLASLPELEAVAHETLRMHPILFEVMRTVKDGMVFQGVEVPAGVHLTAAMPLVHLDPAIYPEPHTFRPQRFLERRYSLCEFFPFGGGHRRCLGAAFALNEIKVVLGTLLMRFDFELAQARPLRPVRRNATMAPEQGVPMRFLGARAAWRASLSRSERNVVV